MGNSHIDKERKNNMTSEKKTEITYQQECRFVDDYIGKYSSREEALLCELVQKTMLALADNLNRSKKMDRSELLREFPSLKVCLKECKRVFGKVVANSYFRNLLNATNKSGILDLYIFQHDGRFHTFRLLNHGIDTSEKLEKLLFDKSYATFIKNKVFVKHLIAGDKKSEDGKDE